MSKPVKSSKTSQTRSDTMENTTEGLKTAKPCPVTPEERWRMIAEAAYYRAEHRGFVGGDTADDWLQASAEIDNMLEALGCTVSHGS